MKRLILICMSLTALSSPAFAHPNPGTVVSFAAGLAHPFSGLDHIAAMVAVGLWATLKGNRALWIWPSTFVGVMLIGAALGMAHIPLPFVEPGILASVVVLGLMVTLAVDVPVAVGAAIIGVFALLHGHSHGAEAAARVNGSEYMMGFALATATLHSIGIGVALMLRRTTLQPAIRLAGLGCVALGVGLFSRGF